MTETDPQRIVESVSALKRGPGGLAALLRDGQVIGKHAWGYADLDRRVPMTADTIMPICSISKQFVCLALGDILRQPNGPAKADKALRELLPPSLSDNKDLTVERLSHMQSGIRDYWALTVLWGARHDQKFTLDQDAPASLQRLGNFHFAPGTEYSYSNVNFHLLGRVVEIVTGRELDDMLFEYVFKPAGMHTAELHPDTNDRPGPVVGYEGQEDVGYFPALNRIEWAGDAGIVASLNDMIAYEQYLIKQHADTKSVYYHNAQPVTFLDGKPASYAWGLRHDEEIGGFKAVGHGAGLRGFHGVRKQVPQSGFSAVVLFNHHGDTREAVNHMIRSISQQPEEDHSEIQTAKGWEGAFLDPETKLAIEITLGKKIGELMLNDSGHPEKLKATSADEARSHYTTASLSGDSLIMSKPGQNRFITAHRIPPASSTDVSALTGFYRSDEIGSTFHVTGSAGMLYGCFDGYLGKGPVHMIRQLGEDVWYMPTERTLDHNAPGCWTIMFERDGEGNLNGATVGCWLARRVPFVKA